MNKGKISNVLRQLKLMHLTDRVRYMIQTSKNKKANKQFLIENPDVILPPDYLMYESFQINYKKYLEGGKEVAEWIVENAKKYIPQREISVLDWGCGPGRVIRHMPSLLGNKSKVFGTDYNNKSIEWCTQNLRGIEFNHNSIEASLPYEDGSFDFIYGISIFTHLSPVMHYKWYAELRRVLKVDGLFFLTTQGDNFKTILTNQEVEKYNNGQLVIRGQVIEGHRTYSAFHPDSFMRELFKNDFVEEVIIQEMKSDKAPPQDAWIVRKK